MSYFKTFGLHICGVVDGDVVVEVDALSPTSEIPWIFMQISRRNLLELYQQNRVL